MIGSFPILVALTQMYCVEPNQPSSNGKMVAMRMKHDKAEMQKAEYLNQALALCHYAFAVWENTPQLA